MKNKIESLLMDLGIIEKDSVFHFYPRVRDRKDISVMKCGKSGVIFLSRSDHIEPSCFEEKKGFEYWGAQDRKMALMFMLEDTERRFKQFKHLVCNKKWMDVGTGAGGILDLLSSLALETFAVEPQGQVRKKLIEMGYMVYPFVQDVPGVDFEIVTLFHVLEHLADPIEVLRAIKKKMKKGAKIVVEVPHAKDFLISFFDLGGFKDCAFWSEHLILHTRESLNVFLNKAGFSNIVIKGCQRYPLANHFYWLAKNKPNGHIAWSHLRTKELDSAYANMLAQIDCTDTLVALAQK